MPKTYCAFPFTHQYVHMSGSVRLCCATTENATDKKGNRIHMNNDSLQKTWNSDYMKQARLKMKDGEVLEACTKCVQQEERGYKSMRDDSGEEENLKNVNADGSMEVMPHSMELHFGNVCNLKCKMCSQDYSNQIGNELLQIGEKDKDFLSWVYKQSGNVNNWTNNLSVEYTWFQNERTKSRLIEYVSNHTTKLTIWASLDGIGDATEYIRYPSNFNKVVENLTYYKKMLTEHGNGSITFSPAVQLLNIHQLDEMLKWFIDFSDGAWGDTFKISWMAQVWYPRICNYDTAPREYRLMVADKLEKSVEHFKKYKGISFFYNAQIKNLRVDHLDKDTEVDLQKSFIRYNDTQDKHRKGNTWRKLLPFLQETLTNSIK